MQNPSPLGWAFRPLKRYAEFSGRSSRAEFWWFFLFLMISYFLVWFLLVAVAGTTAASGTQPSLALVGAFGVASIFMVLFWLALLIPSIAVQVRRLHDTNRSGWWLGGFYLLYGGYFVLIFGMMGALMATAASGNGTPPTLPGSGMFTGIMVFGLVMFVYMIALLVFYCLPGTRGPNRFGDDPYGANVEEVFA
jgi:uncharacterized membrane protein YhaH (DUF805 family)